MMEDPRDDIYWSVWQEPLPRDLEERIRAEFNSGMSLAILELFCREQGVWDRQGEFTEPERGYVPLPDWIGEGACLDQRPDWEKRLETEEGRRLLCRQAIETPGPDGRRAGPVLDLTSKGGVSWRWLDEMTPAQRQAWEEAHQARIAEEKPLENLNAA